MDGNTLRWQNNRIFLASADIVRGLCYLPGLLHPVELDRDLGEGGSLVGTVPPALLHQLITGQGKTYGRVLNTAGKKDLITESGIKDEYLHLIITVFGFLHPVALGQFFIELCTRHATIRCATLEKNKIKNLIVFEFIRSFLEHM